MMDRCAALFTGKYIEYGTPKKLSDELNDEFHFVLDPCTTADNPLGNRFYFTKEDDGLRQSWNVGNDDIGSSVYVNPPYGRNIIDWVQKSSDESIKHNITVVMLIPVRSDTRWFHTYIYDNTKSNIATVFKFDG